MEQKIYIGLDTGKQFCHATIMAEDGKIIKQQKIYSDKNSITDFFQSLPPSQVAIEASACYLYFYKLLQNLGHTVYVSHPYKTYLIAKSHIKTDAKDSEKLAHLLRLQYLPCIFVPSDDIIELREILRQRVFLVRMRTQLKNKIHSILVQNGIFFKKKDIFSIGFRRKLTSLNIYAINIYLEDIEQISSQIKEIDSKLKKISNNKFESKILRSIKGIGIFSSLVIISEIGDINRFKSSEHLSSWAGLVAKVHQSGTYSYYGDITKQGSRYMRWILTEVAQIHVNTADSFLTRFFKKIKSKHGKNIAIVALAHKLLKVIYWMLKEKRSFINN